MAQTTDLWTAKQAAEALGVNVKTLYKALKENDGWFNGVLIAVRISTTWRFIPHAIEKVKAGERPY